MQLPQAFSESTTALLGETVFGRLEQALQTASPVSIRLNPEKTVEPFQGDSSTLFSEEQVPWAPEGRYLPARPSFTFDPLLHAGCYYVQEASSMCVGQVVRQLVDSPVTVLDLCAAPGGKSTQLRSLLPPGSGLVSNEIIRTRAQVLAENMAKWGHPGVLVTQNAPADFADFANSFDLIFTDVPCSGEGMFRKDPVAVSEWSPSAVDACQARQRSILTDIWPCLKPGGLLVYSTCTYNTREDEENVQWFLETYGAQPVSLQLPDSWGIEGNLLEADFPVYRFFPHRVRGEGFFMAVLRKPQTEALDTASKFRPRAGKQPVVPKECRTWVRHSQAFCWDILHHQLVAVPAEMELLYRRCAASLHLLQAGIAVAEQKGPDWVPLQNLALSTQLCKEAFPSCEVDYQQAIAYLRKEALALPTDVPRGYVLLTYRSVPLGFVKNVGNRANNLYPVEWRIRKAL